MSRIGLQSAPSCESQRVRFYRLRLVSEGADEWVPEWSPGSTQICALDRKNVEGKRSVLSFNGDSMAVI